MAKKKITIPLKPAEPVAKHRELAHLEGDARKLYHIKKIFTRAGGEAATEALSDLLRDGPDPSEASAQATVSVHLMSDWIDHHETMSGRKAGALQEETHYLECLVKSAPYERADDLYRRLRAIASNPGDKRNPTPGECPFTYGVVKGNPEVLKRGNHYLLATFKNAISKIKRRLATESPKPRDNNHTKR